MRLTFNNTRHLQLYTNNYTYFSLYFKILLVISRELINKYLSIYFYTRKRKSKYDKNNLLVEFDYDRLIEAITVVPDNYPVSPSLLSAFDALSVWLIVLVVFALVFFYSII